MLDPKKPEVEKPDPQKGEGGEADDYTPVGKDHLNVGKN